MRILCEAVNAQDRREYKLAARLGLLGFALMPPESFREFEASPPADPHSRALFVMALGTSAQRLERMPRLRLLAEDVTTDEDVRLLRKGMQLSNAMIEHLLHQYSDRLSTTTLNVVSSSCPGFLAARSHPTALFRRMAYLLAPLGWVARFLPGEIRHAGASPAELAGSVSFCRHSWQLADILEF